MLLALVCSHRPVASLVWRGGWSHLEHCRAAEKLNEAGKAFFGLSFSVINKGPHCDFMLCTALALLPVFTIQHWLSFGPCSYLPCIYSSHVILVSLFRGVDRPPRPPLPPPPSWLQVCQTLWMLQLTSDSTCTYDSLQLLHMYVVSGTAYDGCCKQWHSQGEDKMLTTSPQCSR